MEDIGLFKQGWRWLQSQKQVYSTTRIAVSCFGDKIMVLVDRHWPMVWRGSLRFGKFVLTILLQWRDCVMRGFTSLIGLRSAALLLIMWSCFLSMTSVSCLFYVLLSLVVAGAGVCYLGFTPGIFIVGLFAILILWIYGNFWVTGTLFIVGGYLFSLNHARLVVLMAASYAIYCVKVRVGWLGVFLSINLAFFSNDILNFLLQGCEREVEDTNVEEEKGSEPVTDDDFSRGFEYSVPGDESESTHSCKSSNNASATSVSINIDKESLSRVIDSDTSSMDEIKRIMTSLNHYEALGLPRDKFINATLLRKEYLKKAMLVHPDKNLGSPLASESFKKLQCAYEVLADLEKKKDYDERLRREECRSVYQKSHSNSEKVVAEYHSEESRRIQCTKCGNSHIWICTNRTKAKARWCQDCCQYHPAKDGDGWVEGGCSLFPKEGIPRAFVCAENKIFDVSEWASCQGMGIIYRPKPNTHNPSFHVNMVGSERMTQRSNSSRSSWGLEAEMMEEEKEFEMWLQQALASGLFSETPKRRKSWSPFKLHQNKGKKQWRRSP
ncbi:hypothetical protein Scep_012199 [Stephania cephalantha]|uniref:J domain-containing protein n=1 Tax=Stephania cephalantha TaxID=152367 RepID=A0AAP0P9M6_9MAGN